MEPIIVIFGQTCSGKTQIFNHLLSKGYVGLEMGSFFSNIMKSHNKNRIGATVNIREFLEEADREKIIRILLDELFNIRKDNIKGYVICGMRNNEDLKIIYKLIKNPITNIFLYADPIIRFERMISRKREGDPNNFKDFLIADYEEIFCGLGQLVYYNRFNLIINNSSVDYLLSELDVIEGKVWKI